jgi:DNA-directed RNA polymerase specialized sigma24 family protein
LTHNASEVFTMQLARAAGKQANRFLRARGLQKADRDDVIAAAMLWCWENRENYSLITTLETWFMNAIRDAYKDFQRNELPTSDESMESLGGADDTYNSAAAESSAAALIGALTPPHKEVALLVMRGYTYREMISQGITDHTIKAASRAIKQMRRLLPDQQSARLISRTAPAVSSDNQTFYGDQLSEIDMELAKLDFAPAAGKDCPPCWRCMWFEGFMPSGNISTRMKIDDLDVREAVTSIESRKVEIAQQVRTDAPYWNERFSALKQRSDL